MGKGPEAGEKWSLRETLPCTTCPHSLPALRYSLVRPHWLLLMLVQPHASSNRSGVFLPQGLCPGYSPHMELSSSTYLHKFSPHLL